MTTSTDRQPRTRRSERGTYADSGAVRTAEGKLPIYECTRCGREVCWATSARTGRRYLVNVRRYADHVNGTTGLGRWYDKSSIHDCEKVDAERDAAREAAAQRKAAEERLSNLEGLRYVVGVMLDSNREKGTNGWDQVREYAAWLLSDANTYNGDFIKAEFTTVDDIINYLWREGLR